MRIGHEVRLLHARRRAREKRDLISNPPRSAVIIRRPIIPWAITQKSLVPLSHASRTQRKPCSTRVVLCCVVCTRTVPEAVPRRITQGATSMHLLKVENRGRRFFFTCGICRKKSSSESRKGSSAGSTREKSFKLPERERR